MVHLPKVGDDYQSTTDKQYDGLIHLYDQIEADYYGILGTDKRSVIFYKSTHLLLSIFVE